MVPTTDTPIRPALRAPWGADADAPGVPLVLARLDEAVSRYVAIAPRFVAREEGIREAFATAREAVEEAGREAVVVAHIVGGPELAERVSEGLRHALREVEAAAFASPARVTLAGHAPPPVPPDVLHARATDPPPSRVLPPVHTSVLGHARTLTLYVGYLVFGYAFVSTVLAMYGPRRAPAPPAPPAAAIPAVAPSPPREDPALVARREEAERDARRTPLERATLITALLAGDPDAGRLCQAIRQRERIPPAERLSVVVRPALRRLAAAEREALRERREAFARSPFRELRCCDGSTSPTCTCGGPHRGCCSHHGGPCGCEPLPTSLDCP